MTAIAGVKILTENYTEKCIRIAFNPLAQPGEERFAVTTPAHEKSSFWIPDISEVFKPGFQSWTFMPKRLQNGLRPPSIPLTATAATLPFQQGHPEDPGPHYLRSACP